MKNTEKKFEEKYRESIIERHEVIGPPDFVSIFHETKSDFLPMIDQEGLKQSTENRNIGRTEAMVRQNKIFDEYRPNEVKNKGISRSNIYAYPFLEHGHGLQGADRRFIKRNYEDLLIEFEILQQHNPDFLKKMGITTIEDYVKEKTDPDRLKLKYPGEIIEIKADPQKCYVGDLEFISRIPDDMHRGLSENEATKNQAEHYWKNLITLKDFLKWYKKPEWAEDRNSIKNADDYRDGEPFDTSGFYPIKGAPKNLPWHIQQPEILIPENIPQEHIKLVKQAV